MRDQEYTLIAEALLELKKPQKFYFCTSWKGLCINEGRGYANGIISDYRNINEYFDCRCGNYALKNAFNRANKNMEKSAEMIEKLTNGKIECNVTEYHIEYIIK